MCRPNSTPKITYLQNRGRMQAEGCQNPGRMYCTLIYRTHHGRRTPTDAQSEPKGRPTVLYFNLLYLRIRLSQLLQGEFSRNCAETEIPIAAQNTTEHLRTNAERTVHEATVNAARLEASEFLNASPTRTGSRILKQIIEKLCTIRPNGLR